MGLLDFFKSGGGPIAPADAKQLVDDGATLLDVRTPAEFRGGHLDGARNVPVQELAGRLAELDRDATYVVYCRSGGRSAQACRMLRAEGIDAHDVGGMGRYPR